LAAAEAEKGDLRCQLA
jgi:hypothetical protein